MFRILLTVLILYVFIVFLAFALQRKLLYFPGRSSIPIVISLAERIELKLWPNQDSSYRGFISKTQRLEYVGTVIIFHGNAGSAIDRSYYVKPLEGLGYRVILAEYPGYGAREGKHGEAIFASDALETVQIAKQWDGPLYLWGESLGCGVASSVARQMESEVQGVILLTAWDSLPNLAQHLYKFLPARLLIKDTYDNAKNLQSFRGPVAVLMAGQDEIIPNRLTQGLYDALDGKKKIWVFPGAGHNSWPSQPDEGWWAEVMDFVSSPD